MATVISRAISSACYQQIWLGEIEVIIWRNLNFSTICIRYICVCHVSRQMSWLNSHLPTYSPSCNKFVALPTTEPDFAINCLEAFKRPKALDKCWIFFGPCQHLLKKIIDFKMMVGPFETNINTTRVIELVWRTADSSLTFMKSLWNHDRLGHMEIHF